MSSRGFEQDTRCLRCGRILSAPASVARGYGRGCRARITVAAETADLSQFTPAQAGKARETIADGAVVPSSVTGTYSAASGDGTLVYLVDAIRQTCSCKAGQNGRRCYHLAAALIIEAAAPARRRVA